MYTFGVFILLMLFGSCQDHKETREVVLSHHSIPMDEDFVVGSPIDMHCVDDNLIIIDAKAEKLFHWIKIPEGKYMGSFGAVGQGPDELLKVRNIHSLNDTLYGSILR